MNIYSVKIYWATEAICTSPGPQSSAFLVTRQYSVYLGERRCLMIRDQSLDSQLWYPKAVKYHRSEHTKSTKWSMRWNTETEADNLCRRHDCHGGKRRTGFYYRCHPSEEHGINQSKMEPPIVGCKDSINVTLLLDTIADCASFRRRPSTKVLKIQFLSLRFLMVVPSLFQSAWFRFQYHSSHSTWMNFGKGNTRRQCHTGTFVQPSMVRADLE